MRRSKVVTVFTSIYNRAYIINTLYQSLQRQTCKDFEWIIIDDGSQDNIVQIVNQWMGMDRNEFAIRFYSVNNGGKHRAINKAVKIAQGDAFFIVDSDDYITDDAIAWIEDKWSDLQDDGSFAGIAGLKILKSGKLTGTGELTFNEYVDATNLEREKYSLDGDKAEVYKTEVLRKFSFPEYENENFVTEAVVWNKIAYEGYKIRWFNKVIYICDYLEDGLSKNIQTVIANNPKGWAEYIACRYKYESHNRNQYIEECRNHFKNCFEKVSLNELAGIWGLDDEELQDISAEFHNELKRYDDFMKANHIQNFALYGYGVCGKRTKRYLNYLGYKEKYIIDKNAKQIEKVPAYSLEDQMPQVENIIICVKRDVEDIKRQIPKIFPQVDIYENP